MDNQKINKRRFQRFLMALCLFFSGLIAQNTYDVWYDTDWLYRQKITSPKNPVFVNVRADDNDILFAAADDAIKLKYDIEKFFTASEGIVFV